VFGVGHYRYWPQFPGLLDEMHRKLAVFVEKVQAEGVRVSDFGLIDEAHGAYDLLPKLKAADLDLIFDGDHESKWTRALARMGVDAGRLSSQGGRA